jgi:hypothetical protein
MKTQGLYLYIGESCQRVYLVLLPYLGAFLPAVISVHLPQMKKTTHPVPHYSHDTRHAVT